MLGNDGTKLIVIFSGGRNDIFEVKGKKLFKRVRQALDKIRSKDGISMVCGVLPRRGLCA